MRINPFITEELIFRLCLSWKKYAQAEISAQIPSLRFITISHCNYHTSVLPAPFDSTIIKLSFYPFQDILLNFFKFFLFFRNSRFFLCGKFSSSDECDSLVDDFEENIDRSSDDIDNDSDRSIKIDSECSSDSEDKSTENIVSLGLEFIMKKRNSKLNFYLIKTLDIRISLMNVRTFFLLFFTQALFRTIVTVHKKIIMLLNLILITFDHETTIQRA